MESRFDRIVDFVTRDHHSSLDPFIKWVRRPWVVLALAVAASTLCGFYLHPRAFVLASGLAAVLAVGFSWPWIALAGVSGTLALEKTRAREGDTLAARLVLRNRCPWTAWGLYPRGDFPGQPTAIGSSAPGWRSSEVSWEFVPRCRGVYPRAALEVATGFPFGVREAARPLSVEAPLVVWPRAFPVGPLPEAAMGEEGEGLACRNRPGHAGDLLGVRAYRRGDSVRRIHWPQTARRGDLVVCELQSLAIPRIQIVLDLCSDEPAPRDPDGLLEWSVRVAASFAEQWGGEGARVELVAGQRSVTTSPGPGRARTHRLLDFLARLEPSDWCPLERVLDGDTCRRFGRGLRIVVASDVAIRGLAQGRRSLAAERFVVFRAASFGVAAPELDPADLPARPWIWIDGSKCVPQQTRAGWREVANAR